MRSLVRWIEDLRNWSGARGEKNIVRTGFGDSSGLEHQDPIGSAGGYHPVCDRDGGPATGEGGERILHPDIGRRIESTGRLVQNQQIGVHERCSGQRHELSFPGRQQVTAQSHLCAQPVGQRGASLAVPGNRSPR